MNPNYHTTISLPPKVISKATLVDISPSMLSVSMLSSLIEKFLIKTKNFVGWVLI